MNIKEVAEKVAKYSFGRVFICGGYVRDLMIGVENLDTDILMLNISKKELEDLGIKVAEKYIYSNIKVYIIEELDMEVTFLDNQQDKKLTKKAINQLLQKDYRDLTINNMYLDVLTGEIIDLFSGKEHILKKEINYTDKKYFKSNQINKYRAIAFSARFNFRLADSILKEIKTMNDDVSLHLLGDVLLKGIINPETLFETLEETGTLNELFGLVYTTQEKAMIMFYLNKMKKYTDKLENLENMFYLFLGLYLSAEEKENFYQHDFFKYRKHTKKYCVSLQDSIKEYYTLSEESKLDVYLGIYAIKDFLILLQIFGCSERESQELYLDYLSILKKNKDKIQIFIGKKSLLKFGMNPKIEKKEYKKLKDKILYKQIEGYSLTELESYAKKLVKQKF